MPFLVCRFGTTPYVAGLFGGTVSEGVEGGQEWIGERESGEMENKEKFIR